MRENSFRNGQICCVQTRESPEKTDLLPARGVRELESRQATIPKRPDFALAI
jgi:hypothetical protein